MGTPIGTLTQLVLECEDAAALAAFWQELLGLEDPVIEPDWVTLQWAPVGRLSCHQVQGYRPPEWPGEVGDLQLHFDLLVDDFEQADQRAQQIDAVPLGEVINPGPKAWRVYTDPAGHPFCLVSTPE